MYYTSMRIGGNYTQLIDTACPGVLVHDNQRTFN